MNSYQSAATSEPAMRRFRPCADRAGDRRPGYSLRPCPAKLGPVSRSASPRTASSVLAASVMPGSQTIASADSVLGLLSATQEGTAAKRMVQVVPPFLPGSISATPPICFVSALTRRFPRPVP